MYHFDIQQFKLRLLYHLKARWYIYHMLRITSKRMVASEPLLSSHPPRRNSVGVVYVPLWSQ